MREANNILKLLYENESNADSIYVLGWLLRRMLAFTIWLLHLFYCHNCKICRANDALKAQFIIRLLSVVNFNIVRITKHYACSLVIV